MSDLDWDGGHLFHPDERHILMVTEGVRLPFPIDLGSLLTPESPLNPRSFAYGSLIFYLLRFVHWFANALLSLVGLGGDVFGVDVRNLRFFGRALSALFDTGTVYLTFLLGRTLYGRRVGLLAAAFVAFSVLNIQLSHFYASDTPMTFFVVATLFMAARFVKRGRQRDGLGAAVAAGMALACKISAAPILGAVAAAYLLREVLPADGAPGRSGPLRLNLSAAALNRGIGAFLLALIVVVATLVLFQPYAVIDAKTFLAHVAEQSSIARGIADVPYGRQYANRPAYWYFVENLALFGVGLPLGLAMMAGWAYVIWRAIREPNRADLLLLAFVVPYFAITGSFHAKFLRYLLPITPVLALFASIGLWRFYEWATARAAPAVAPTEWAELNALPEIEPVQADEMDDETRRVMELKGFSFFSDAPAAAPPKPAEPEVDEETRRWLESKGLALFDAVPEPDAAPTELEPTSPGASLSVPKTDEPARLWTWPRRLAAAALAITLGFTVLYGLAYQNVYAGEHTAVEASRWIYQNVPRGSTLAKEHWEEGFPVAVPALDGSRRQLDPGVFGYRQVDLNLYEADDPHKLDHIVQTVARTDYILFFSNRLYGTIPRLPERYPLTSKYYQLLFAERLGFELAAVFTRYPSIAGVAFLDDTLQEPGLAEPPAHAAVDAGPIELNLGRADESFSVYDHPKVLVFRKTQRLTEPELRAMLQPSLPPPGRAVVSRPGQAVREFGSTLQSPELRAIQEAGGTFAELFDRDGLANRLPALVWVVMLIVVGLAALPLSTVALSRLGDVGFTMARAIGLLLMTWVSWMAVAVLGLEAGRATAYLGFIALLVVGALLARRALAALRELWSTRRTTLIASELAFWVPFAYWLWIRMLNPDLWHSSKGGEKPMDLAYLMATIKSAAYPPYDPWLAGANLNYYYYGQLIVAQMIKLTGVIPTTAYNLAIPTLAGLTFCGAFGVAYNLARRGGLVSERAAIGAGVAAALMVGIFGNLVGVIQLGEGLVRLSGTSYQSLVPGLNYVILVGVGLFNWIVLRRPYDIPTDWYWQSTRVIPGTINEFPYFTFLYADLHAHMIALPFTLLALAVAVNLFMSAPPKLQLDYRLRFAMPVALPRPRFEMPQVRELARTATLSVPDGAIQIVVAGLAVGALLPINSWDFPTYLGLVGTAGLAPWYLQERRDLGSLIASIARIAVVAALSYVLYLPFHRSFVSFTGSIRPSDDQSSPLPYLLIHGLFLFILISYLARDVATALRPTGASRSLAAMARRWDRMPHMLELRRRLVKRDDGSGTFVQYGLLGMLAIVLVGVALGYELTGLLLALLVPVLWRLFSRPRSPESALVLLLFATGLALSAIVEIILPPIAGDVGRMNWVFKLYLQIWVIWGVAAGVALTAMRDRVVTLVRPGAGRGWAIVLSALVLSCAIYPVIAARGKTVERFDRTIPPTLDGTAYMETAVWREDQGEARRPVDLRFARDKQAIEWIWDNVKGSPTILEAQVPEYRWGSRISIYTGLPTVVGWPHHEKQRHGNYAPGVPQIVDDRVRDVRALYSDVNRERALVLLRQHNVTYVYVGDLERAFYPEAGLQKFDAMVGSDLDLVYDRDGVKIYKLRGKP